MGLCNKWMGIIEQLGSSFGSIFLMFPKKVGVILIGQSNLDYPGTHRDLSK